MEDVVLNWLLVTSVFEHARQALHTTHAATNACPDFRRLPILVPLVGVCNAGHVEGLSCADKSPESRAVSLSDDVSRDTKATRFPTRRDLAGNGAAERERLRDEDPRTLLELDEPLAFACSPDVTLVTVFVLELLRVGLSRFERFQIVEKFDLLMEDFLLWIIALEELRF